MKIFPLWLVIVTCLCSYVKAAPNIKNIVVTTSKDIYQALKVANQRQGYTTILFKDGIYQLPSTLVINAPSVTLASLSGQRDKVILTGNGMKASKTSDNLIYVAAPHFTLNGITLQQSGSHLIQISGQDDADYTTISNCILRDSYQQLLKISDGKDISADYGVIDDCVFEYSAGIGPQWYIGGIDAHGAKNWFIKNNTFKDIASPSKRVAEHAIHFWNRSVHNIIENNVIVDCDRGIGFGLQNKGNEGGTIKNNIIIHNQNADPFADVGIIIENSPNTLIENNYIYLSHNYPNAIEYRFNGTTEAMIQKNVTNKKIISRNGARAWVVDNQENLTKEKVLTKKIEKIIKRHLGYIPQL